METVLMKEKKCWLCGTTYNLHSHHVFGASDRKWSEHFGLKLWLCADHHNMSAYSVHLCRQLDLKAKIYAQEYFEGNIGTREDFRRYFRKSYL